MTAFLVFCLVFLLWLLYADWKEGRDAVNHGPLDQDAMYENWAHIADQVHVPSGDSASRFMSSVSEPPWDSLEVVYGPATCVPHIFKILAFGEGEIQEEGILDGLDWFTQGTLHSSSPYIVPLLIQILEMPKNPAIGPILVRLDSLCNPRITAMSASGGRISKKLEDQYRLATVANIRLGKSVYEMLTESSDDYVRRRASELLDTLDGLEQPAVQ